MRKSGCRGRGVTEILARFATDLTLEQVPSGVIHEAKRTILNYLGLAMGGTSHPTTGIVLDVAKEIGSAPICRVIGTRARLDPFWAALVHGVAAHVEDFDDTHLKTLIHPGAPILSAILAAGGPSDPRGDEVLLSTIVGVEVALRVGIGLGIGHWERGYHLTSTCGVIGAAAGASRMMRLRPDQVATAIGLGSTQSSGVLGMLGTDAKSFHAGHAASGGVVAAMLAKRGFTAAGIEGARGFAEVVAPNPDLGTMVAGLGSEWLLLENTYKAFACGVVAHPAMDAAITLADREDLRACDVASIEVDVDSSVLTVMGVQNPQTSLEGKFSIFHCVAVSLADRTGGVAQFTDERVNAAEMVNLRERVTVRTDESMDRDQARVTVRMKDGTDHTLIVSGARGSLARPLSDTELENKFRSLVDGTSLARNASSMIDSVWNLERVASFDRLLEQTVPTD